LAIEILQQQKKSFNYDLNDDIIDNNVIDYWHKELQLTKNDENIFLSPNG
jgi:hypothetical protein